MVPCHLDVRSHHLRLPAAGPDPVSGDPITTDDTRLDCGPDCEPTKHVYTVEEWEALPDAPPFVAATMTTDDTRPLSARSLNPLYPALQRVFRESMPERLDEADAEEMAHRFRPHLEAHGYTVVRLDAERARHAALVAAAQAVVEIVRNWDYENQHKSTGELVVAVGILRAALASEEAERGDL